MFESPIKFVAVFEVALSSTFTTKETRLGE
jgi:hypothetical protein